MGNSEQAKWLFIPRKYIIGALVLALVFLAGYVPPRMEVARVEREKAEIQQQLELTDLRGTLGMIFLQVYWNNYGEASKLSTRFFDGLKDVADRTQDPARQDALRRLLARRDEITTGLAQLDPAVKDKIALLYGELAGMSQRTS